MRPEAAQRPPRPLPRPIDALTRRLRASAVGSEGLSLVELLVAMVVMIVIMSAVLSAWSRLESTYTFTNDDLVAQAQSRTAMGEMVASIRTSQLNREASFVWQQAVIPVAKPNEVWLWVDAQADGTLQLVKFKVDTDAGILYRLSGVDAQKLVTADVVNDTTRPLFTYYGANQVPLDAIGGGGAANPTGVADPTEIREVHIDLLVDVATMRGPIAHHLSSVVQPRNLRQY